MSEEIKPSPAVPEPPGSTNAEADGPQRLDALIAAGTVNEAHRNPNHGARGRFVVGNQAAVTTGLHRKQAIDAESVWLASCGGHRYAVLCRVHATLEQKTLQFAESMQPQASHVKQLSSMFDGLRASHAELAATEASMSQDEVWRKVAGVFQRRADEFIELVREVLEAHPEFAPVLRAALDVHDARPQPASESSAARMPVGKPRARFDTDDEVIL